MSISYKVCQKLNNFFKSAKTINILIDTTSTHSYCKALKQIFHYAIPGK